jgi:23S rRNA (adenine2503-C2)-methyltransferase
MFDYKVFKSSNETVSKYVFTCPTAVAEAVLYQYKTRTVICCSTQSGCPVGCTFCGTGKRFVRNLTSEEIVEQVDTVIMDSKTDVSEIQKFQIMFMSMGEPLLNWNNVKEAIHILNSKYPKAQLLLSTIAPRYKNDEIIKDVIMVAKDIDKVGLQFSIHKSTDEQRNKLIPYRNKYTLEEIAEFGKEFCLETGRNPYLNYCVDGTNNTETDADNLKKLFIPEVFCFTFSVVCSSDETMKDASYRNLKSIRNFEQLFINDGYSTRIFDPAGQDDIGGGCGQLWYTQKWIKEHRKKKYRPFDPATFEQHYDIEL